ncbi:hypothetical protein DMENIID0001_097980 [Sergentomyia squamirostris]
MKLIFIIICFISSGWTKYNVPHLDIDKRDLFMSRGWGASGMPYPMFYLNRYTQTQQIQHKADSRLFPEVALISSFAEKPAEVQTKTVAQPAQHRKTNQSRKPQTLPQLFISYGWGPLG